jgi:hypothetical protein
MTRIGQGTYRCSPVHNCLKFSAVLPHQLSPHASGVSILGCNITEQFYYQLILTVPILQPSTPSDLVLEVNPPEMNDLPIFIRPAGVSPMLISKNTTGLVTPAGGSRDVDAIIR